MSEIKQNTAIIDIVKHDGETLGGPIHKYHTDDSFLYAYGTDFSGANPKKVTIQVPLGVISWFSTKEL